MIDKNRIAVLIGRKGTTKKLIEDLTRTKIEINSDTGDYQIEFNNDEEGIQQPGEEIKSKLRDVLEELNLEDISLDFLSFEPNFSIWMANNIIDAINMGFKPEKALKLVDQDYSFEKIQLESSIGSSEKKMKRMMGRIIGEKGKMRSAIEHFSGAHISIYPPKKIIGLIGDFDSLKIARKAVNMILEGLPHRVIYMFLQKKMQERKDEEFQQNWKPSFT